jgi:cell division protein ZapA (FtsZ GTPase activity inhibitor)
VDLLAERNEQIESLKQVEQAMAQLEKQFTEMQTQRERVIGAILLIDKWLNTENEQQKAPVNIDQG